MKKQEIISAKNNATKTTSTPSVQTSPAVNVAPAQTEKTKKPAGEKAPSEYVWQNVGEICPVQAVKVGEIFSYIKADGTQNKTRYQVVAARLEKPTFNGSYEIDLLDVKGNKATKIRPYTLRGQKDGIQLNWPAQRVQRVKNPAYVAPVETKEQPAVQVG